MLDASPDVIDAAVEESAVVACGGECTSKTASACTCAVDDPCQWAVNGVCDQACYAFASGFDDTVDCDADEDSMLDFVEHDLAKGFAPALILAAAETCADRNPFWAVQPLGDAKHASIFYALSYLQDCGDPETGLYQHLGDTEFVVVEVSTVGGTTWTPDRIFLSAHYGAGITDGSAWHEPEQLQFFTDDGLAHPLVWVAESKHGNYATAQACDQGGAYFDHCDKGTVEFVETLVEHNLGSQAHPLIDEVLFTQAGVEYREWYWTDVPFCGWLVPSAEPADRTGCVPANASYMQQMGAWLAGLK